MRNALQSLRGLVERRSLMAAYYDGFYKKRQQRALWRKQLFEFLDSTMDEPRVQRSQRAAHTALHIYDLAELLHLRRDVLKRETFGNIAYPGQRDHTAHTLNNWLLGWWLVESSGKVKKALKVEFSRRGLLAWNRNPFHETFGDLWQAASLLHDIGYVFEGAITGGSLETTSEHVRQGAVLVENFFRHKFLFDSGVRSLAMYDAVQTRLGPEFELRLLHFSEPGNLPTMAQELGAIDEGTEALRKAAVISEEHDAHLRQARVARAAAPSGNGMVADAFDLWARSYAHFGQPTMANRVMSLRRMFREHVFDGIGGSVRVLDHAVCSGLIVLHHSTQYYLLFRALEDGGWEKTHPHDDVYREMIALRDDMRRSNYHLHWWWASIVWATAAAALHNGLQEGAIEKLHLQDDPLAYLGVMVDALQHWDRYVVARGGALGTGGPIEGNRVHLGTKAGKLTVMYEDRRRATAVKDELTRSLAGWDSIVQVVGPA